jgi:hypothetical protein
VFSSSLLGFGDEAVISGSRVGDGGDEGDDLFLLVKKSSAKFSSFMSAPH